MSNSKMILTGVAALASLMFAGTSQAAYSFEPIGKPASDMRASGTLILARKGADDPAGHVRQGRGKDDGKGHGRHGHGHEGVNHAGNPAHDLDQMARRGRGRDDGAHHA